MASFLLGIVILVVLILWRFPQGGIRWPWLYSLLSLQEVLLMGLPALLMYLKSEASILRLRERLAKPNPEQAGLTSLAGVSFTLASLLVVGVWYGLIQQVGFQLPLEVDTIVPESVGELAVALVAAAFLPALCEELFFRGILFDWLQRRWGDRWAVWVSAILFSALHFSLLGFASLLLIGWFLARLRLRYGGLVLPMLFHGVYNASVLLMNTYEAQPNPTTIMLCAGVFILTSYFLLRRGKAT